MSSASHGDYVIQPVEPERIVAFFAGLADSGLVGCNVTVPHKEAAFAAVARREAAAEETGALNTVWIEDGRLVGTNTDPGGFLANLDVEVPGWDAHGGPRWCSAPAARRGRSSGRSSSRGFAPVTVVNRTRERAEALGRRFGRRVAIAGWDALPAALADARLLVNTTTLGMHGQPLLEVDVSRLPRRCGRQRPRLRADGDAADRRARVAGLTRSRRPRHAAAPGGRRASPTGSASGPR